MGGLLKNFVKFNVNAENEDYLTVAKEATDIAVTVTVLVRPDIGIFVAVGYFTYDQTVGVRNTYEAIYLFFNVNKRYNFRRKKPRVIGTER